MALKMGKGNKKKNKKKTGNIASKFVLDKIVFVTQSSPVCSG